VVAQGAARWYAAEGFGPPEKMHVLWKGVHVARFDRARAEAARKRAELGLAPDELAVGTVGRLAWQKGIDDLLEAVRRVRPRLPAASSPSPGIPPGGRRWATPPARASPRTSRARACSTAARRSCRRSTRRPRSAPCTSASARPRKPSAPRHAPGSRRTCRAR